jgi:hypothetical protein
MCLGRFSAEPEQDNPPLWVLEYGTGKIRRSSVHNEAAVTHYNRLDNEEPDLAERGFSEIESLAGPALGKVSSGEPILQSGRIALAIFLQLQHQRTPRMRENMRFVHSQGARIFMQMTLSDREIVRSFLESEGQDVTDEEIDSWQSEMLTLIEDGLLRPNLGWNNEVLNQFAMADKLPMRLCAEMFWTVMRATGSDEFIISDHPVHIYDPEAYPDRSGAWFSSTRVEVTFPVDRKTCLLLRPGGEGWNTAKVDSSVVRNVNLRSYASSEQRCYGSGQHVLQRVWSSAKRNPKLLAVYRPRPTKLINLERTGERSAPLREAGFAQAPANPEIRRFRKS